jgi:hypothetical protein
VILALAAIDEACEQFHKEDSFLGIDVLDEGELEPELCASYFRRAYDKIRNYSTKALVILSDRKKWKSILSSEMWPRLSPKTTGIVIDTHHYTEQLDVQG